METTPSSPDPIREAENPEVEMFKCKACETPKPRTAEHFAPHARTRDGLNTTCRKCIRKTDQRGPQKQERQNSSREKSQTCPQP